MNLKQRIDQAWDRLYDETLGGTEPASPFVGWIWHFDIDQLIADLRSTLFTRDRLSRELGTDDMTRLDSYMRLKEPWRFEE
jgi:hypothetical protein